jgi:hypothetical protein
MLILKKWSRLVTKLFPFKTFRKPECQTFQHSVIPFQERNEEKNDDAGTGPLLE